MIEQRSPEWYAERLGKVTASRLADVTAKTKSGYSTSRANYMAQLIAEIQTGVPQDSYTNAAMQWGIDHEEEAVSAYEFLHDVETHEVGFFAHPKIERSGASPDRAVGGVGLLEVKCPNTATHIETLLGAAIDRKYAVQMHWQMACTGRQWCDFVSYDPRMKESLRLYRKRFVRDDSYIADLEREVITFLAELDRKLRDLDAYELGLNTLKVRLAASIAHDDMMKKAMEPPKWTI